MSKLRTLWLVFAVMSVLSLIEEVEADDLCDYPGQSVRVSALIRLEEATFHVYDPPFKAKGVYTSINEAKCRTPEELVISIQSEMTQEWVDYNWLDGKGQTVTAAQFEKRKSRDKDSNYFELVHKLAFMCNGIKTAIIKYWFIDEGKHTILANMVVQEKNRRWYRANVLGLDHLSAVVMRVKSDDLYTLLKTTSSGQDVSKEKESADTLKVKLREAVIGEQGVLDTERLYNEIMRLRSEGRTNELFQFIDKSGG